MMCPPCDRNDRIVERRDAGKHRAHSCERGGISACGSVGYWCDCQCNAPSRDYVPPVMALTAY